MLALAGVVSAMLLASCQKEVEIDGDVEKESSSYSYRYTVSGTATHVYETYDPETKKWTSYPGEERIANMATISWSDDNKNTNQTVYYINVFYSGTGLEEKDGAAFGGELIEHGDKYYFKTWNEETKDYCIIEVTVNGSPKGREFTMSAKNLLGWVNWPHEETRVFQHGLYTFDSLKFSR